MYIDNMYTRTQLSHLEFTFLVCCMMMMVSDDDDDVCKYKLVRPCFTFQSATSEVKLNQFTQKM